MSGHSKWATTKRQKAVVDAKKGAIFTKIAKLITIAARKGGDPDVNFSLRMAMDKGRAVNMPKDNIDRAVKRGTGEAGGAQIEELTYEGIGPVKTQFIVKCLSDNKNRTASEIRHLFSKHGGALGSVMWNFSQRGVIMIESEEINSKKLTDENFELELIDAGAEDIKREAEGMTIYTAPADLQKAKQFLENKNIKTASAEVEYVAKEPADLSEEEKNQVEKFIEELDNNEDVSDYYTNANL
ncbi:MAG: YebC/PmpR family DNA-binding transcriptional regulator [Patescibacteria group bacterium]|nr:YebC/PmpR family DNA-binding transcriptional regulator [Patescibacteria group bacterium]